ncbi:hypothetical protein OG21DRAFT_1604633 [Imleria badia]|nr:hypothetical protein OG21DRAFT_1604633 [Imleria badia]
MSGLPGTLVVLFSPSDLFRRMAESDMSSTLPTLCTNSRPSQVFQCYQLWYNASDRRVNGRCWYTARVPFGVSSGSVRFALYGGGLCFSYSRTTLRRWCDPTKVLIYSESAGGTMTRYLLGTNPTYTDGLFRVCTAIPACETSPYFKPCWDVGKSGPDVIPDPPAHRTGHMTNQ